MTKKLQDEANVWAILLEMKFKKKIYLKKEKKVLHIFPKIWIHRKASFKIFEPILKSNKRDVRLTIRGVFGKRWRIVVKTFEHLLRKLGDGVQTARLSFGRRRQCVNISQLFDRYANSRFVQIHLTVYDRAGKRRYGQIVRLVFEIAYFEYGARLLIAYFAQVDPTLFAAHRNTKVDFWKYFQTFNFRTYQTLLFKEYFS